MGTSTYANIRQESYKNAHREKNSEIEWRDRVQSHGYDDETFLMLTVQFPFILRPSGI